MGKKERGVAFRGLQGQVCCGGGRDGRWEMGEVDFGKKHSQFNLLSNVSEYVGQVKNPYHIIFDT